MFDKPQFVALGNPNAINPVVGNATNNPAFFDTQEPTQIASAGGLTSCGHKPLVLAPITRESEFGWIDVVWREPRPSKQNSSNRFESNIFPQLVESLADRLIRTNCLQITHLYARFPPADEARVINSRWLTWMLIGKSAGNLWSGRCALNIDRLVWFVPSDVAEGLLGLCWHCAIYVSKDRLDYLVHQIDLWEKDHESELTAFERSSLG
jgi:hypothetical protein